MSDTYDDLPEIDPKDEYDFGFWAYVDPNGDIRFDFGPHAGKKLRDIPSGFLKWMSDKDFPDDLLLVCKEELKAR